MVPQVGLKTGSSLKEIRDKIGDGPRCCEEDVGSGNEFLDGGGRQENHQHFGGGPPFAPRAWRYGPTWGGVLARRPLIAWCKSTATRCFRWCFAADPNLQKIRL
jgi:hypothetical protein